MKQIALTIILCIIISLSIDVSAQIKTPEFAFSPLKSYSLNKLKGNIVVINIWSPEYQHEIKMLNKLAEKYKDNKVIFLAVTDEAYESSIPFLENGLFSYQYLVGGEAKKIFDTYQTGMFKTYPIHIIISQDGKVVYKKKGTRKNIGKNIEKKIETLLNHMQSNIKPIPKDKLFSSKKKSISVLY